MNDKTDLYKQRIRIGYWILNTGYRILYTIFFTVYFYHRCPGLVNQDDISI